MDRNMIRANQRLFKHLVDYCHRRGEAIAAPQAVRYISTDDEDKRFLRELELGALLRFGNHRSLTHLTFQDRHYVALMGFEFEPTLVHVGEGDLNAGMATCLWSELLPLPIVSAAQVRNVIEVGSRLDPSYDGHEASAIGSVFPRITVLESAQSLDADSAWRLFLMICAEECRQGGSWVESSLAEELVSLTDLNIPSMPYPAICRSMFDADPRSLFMALYRCLEATYAYESSRRLVERLAVGIAWQDMANALEREVGWRPQEASSLNLVLQYAINSDLEELCACLRVEPGSDLRSSAGKAVYSLRNGIVHYRPGMAQIDTDSVDWNRLCEILIRIVFHVFTRAYS